MHKEAVQHGEVRKNRPAMVPIIATIVNLHAGKLAPEHLKLRHFERGRCLASEAHFRDTKVNSRGLTACEQAVARQ